MITFLPNEMIIKIASLLDDKDYVALACIDKELCSLLAGNKQILNLEKCYNFSSTAPVETFLVASSKWDILSQLDLSNCYWLDGEMLKKTILHISCSLTNLSVQGTQLNSCQIAEILKQCNFVSHLSLTLDEADSTFWLKDLNENEEVLDLCVFSGLENFNQLTSVALYGDVHSLLMFSAFLCFCSNLESLHLEIGPDCTMPLALSLRVIQRIRNLRRSFPPCNRFHQLTCRIYNQSETTDLLVQLVNNILSRKPNQLDVLWAPNISIKQYLHCLVPSAKSLQTTACADSFSDFKEVTSLKTSMQQFLRRYASDFPLLETISFRYEPEAFIEFCALHKDIKVLQLQHDLPGINQPGIELSLGLVHLTKLTKFSTSLKFFQTEVCSEANEVLHPIQQLVKCQLLEEIEIGLSTSSALESDLKLPIRDAKSSCLSLFSCCKMLTSLTLANLKVNAFEFLSVILSSCSKLKLLRLTKVFSDHPTFISDIVGELEKGLPMASNLQDFRWELGYEETSNMSKANLVNEERDDRFLLGPEILVALKLCRSLRRFVIISDQSVIVDLKKTKMEWTSLILMCIIAPSLNQDVREFRITSTHPAFQSYIGSSLAEASAKLPSVHVNEMVLFESQIAKLPQNC